MKLSTRIMRDTLITDYTRKPIRLMVDCGKTEDVTVKYLSYADKYHEDFLAKGYKLLPKECPVVNKEYIVIHYTSTTYADWCKPPEVC